jgi:hypothetical protein
LSTSQFRAQCSIRRDDRGQISASMLGLASGLNFQCEW